MTNNPDAEIEEDGIELDAGDLTELRDELAAINTFLEEILEGVRDLGPYVKKSPGDRAQIILGGFLNGSSAVSGNCRRIREKLGLGE